MRLLLLSLRGLRLRLGGAALAVLLLAAALACGVVAVLGTHQLTRAFALDRAGMGGVLGAPGDATALVMGSLFQLEPPPGSLPMAQAHALRERIGVADAVPLVLGDNFRGYRIVGTRPDYLALYGATFADGQAWRRTLQTVVGAEVARATGIQVNNTFIATHGLEAGGTDKHKQAPLRVVGVLAPCGCVLDRLIITPLESVWYLHDDAMTADDSEMDGRRDAHRSITAVLVPAGATAGVAGWAPQAGLQLAPVQPALAQWQAGLRQVNLALHVAALVLLVCGAGALAWVLRASARAPDGGHALLDLLGAPAGRRVALVLCQAALLAGLASLLGLLIGHGVAHGLGQAWQARLPVRLNGLVWDRSEWVGVAVLLAATLVAAAWPARLAARASALQLVLPAPR